MANDYKEIDSRKNTENKTSHTRKNGTLKRQIEMIKIVPKTALHNNTDSSDCSLYEIRGPVGNSMCMRVGPVSLKTCPVHIAKQTLTCYPVYQRNEGLPTKAMYFESQDYGESQQDQFGYNNHHVGQNYAMDDSVNKEYYESQYSDPSWKKYGSSYNPTFENQDSKYFVDPAVNTSEYSQSNTTYPNCNPPAQPCNYNKCDPQAQTYTCQKKCVPLSEKRSSCVPLSEKRSSCVPLSEKRCSEENLPLAVHCPAYDYLTFNQFREIKELFKVFCKHFFRFLFLLFFTVIFFSIALCVMIWLIEKLHIGFELEPRTCESDSCPLLPEVKPCTRRDRSFWDALRPRTSDLWKQCF